MANPVINLLIVDDHKMVRNGIKKLLAEQTGLRVVGEAASGEDAVKFVRSNNTDVVLMDIEMPPGYGGFEATRRMLRFNPDLKIIILTAHNNDPFPARFMKAGAAGYLTKNCGAEEMVQAIRSAYSGQRYMSPEIAQKLAISMYSGKKDSPIDRLSDRELQVMLMITKGQKVQEISEELCLSPKTINSYRYRLFEKLGAKTDVELTHLAIRLGLVDIDTSLITDDAATHAEE